MTLEQIEATNDAIALLRGQDLPPKEYFAIPEVGRDIRFSASNRLAREVRAALTGYANMIDDFVSQRSTP
jgi:hypothetical protein